MMRLLDRRRSTARRVWALMVAVGAAAAVAGCTATPTAPSDEQPEASRIVLSLTESPSSSQAVTWRTDADVDEGTVELRRAGGDDVRVVPATTSDTISSGTGEHAARSHSAVVDGLEPGTAYEYRVGHDDRWSAWFGFTTAEADLPEEGFTFLAFGDVQNDVLEAFTPVAEAAFDAVPEARFALHAGDLIDDAVVDEEWGEWFQAQGDATARIPVLTTPGNHEYWNDVELVQYRSHFSQPHNGPQATSTDPLIRAYEERIAAHLAGSVYYIDYPGVRIVSLNGNAAVPSVSDIVPATLPECDAAECVDPATIRTTEVFLRMQSEWLEGVLADNPERWTIVTFHQPVFSTAEGRDNPEVREAWLPILEKYDVDLVLSGHDHTYGRGHLTSNGTTTPGVSSGPVYVVSMSGPKYNQAASPEDSVWTRNGAVEVIGAQFMSTYQVVDVTPDTIHYRAIVAAKGADATIDQAVGEVFDEFTITRDTDGTKWVTDAGIAAPRDER